MISVAASFVRPLSSRPFLGLDKDFDDRSRAGSDGVLGLPATLTWDLVPPIHPPGLVTGARWVDTIAVSSSYAGMAQTIRGMRTSRLVRDTTIIDRHFWLVRDSLRITYIERSASYERTLAAEVFTDRDTRGVATGEYLVDPVTRVVRVRDDTTELRGTATLRYPDGRTFRTPTILQQTRHIAAFDSVTRDSVVQARRAAQPRFSMFRLPTGSVEEQLASGNRSVRDSLLRAYDASRDVDQRSQLRRALQQWRGENYQAFRDTLRTIDLRDGDTGSVVSSMTDPAQDRLTLDHLHLMLPFMRDPGRALAWGIERDPFYEDIPQRLRETPPAITADTTRWPCTPAACAELVAQRTRTTEPRLRRVATVAAFVLDPRRWIDSIRGDSSLAPFHDMIRGVGATWPASSHPPLPAADADWHAWIEWMNGAPDTAAASRPPGTPPPLRFGDSHRQAVAFHDLFTGQNSIVEWQRRADHAQNETERYVFETMLAGANAWRPSPDSVAIWLTSGTKIGRARGSRGASVIMADAAPITDTALVTALIDRVLSHVMDNEQPWPSLGTTGGGGPIGALLDNATRPGRGLAAQPTQTIYVKTPIVTQALRAQWGKRVIWITDPRWTLTRDRYPAAVVTIHGLAARGAFASIGADVFSASADAKGVNAGEGGNKYILLLTPEGWKIVSTSTWVV